MATLQDSLADPAVLVAGTNITLDQPAPGDPVTISASAPSSGSFTGCRLRRAAAQSIGSGVSLSATAIPWDTEDYDTNSFHDNATNPSRITIPAGLGGYYSVKAGAGYNVDNTGRAIFRVQKNGVDIPGCCSDVNGGVGIYPTVSLSTDVALVAGDYLEFVLRVAATTARSLDLSLTAMTLVKIG